MRVGTDILKPYLVQAGVEPKGIVVIGTTKGDLHDIGKNLVRMMMEGAGFSVIDLGVDVSAETFVNAMKEHNAQIVAISSLLTTTMMSMKDCIMAIEESGLRDKVKIMVGGAPVTEEFAMGIGADAYTLDAKSAADKALELIKKL